MKPGFRKRAAASLLAVALAATTSPFVTHAASPAELIGAVSPADGPHQFTNPSACLALGGNSLGAVTADSSGLGRIFSLGSGGFYGGYSTPAYSSFGLGTVGGYMQFTGGSPTYASLLAGSPYCAGLNLAQFGNTGTTGTFLLRDFRVGAATPGLGTGILGTPFPTPQGVPGLPYPPQGFWGGPLPPFPPPFPGIPPFFGIQ
jgi:hypothetical protein